MKARITLVLVVDVPAEPSAVTLQTAVDFAADALKSHPYEGPDGHWYVGLVEVESTNHAMEWLNPIPETEKTT